MANTNFGVLTDEELTVWSRETLKAARNVSFINKFVGDSAGAMIHRTRELTKTNKGARAVITLVQDAEGDGVAGDRQLEGNEEAMKSDDIVINVDQLRHAHKHEGKMADQRSVVRFRQEARNTLAYWLADRWDQMAILTLSGISYAFHNTGQQRVGSQLELLEFAADVSAPTDERHFRWDDTTGQLEPGDTTAMDAADIITWEALVQLKAEAEERYIKPVRLEDGVSFYNVFVTPTVMSQLLRDNDFKQNLRDAAPRSNENILFKGSETYWVNNMAIHSHRHVFNTRRAPNGEKWGAGPAFDVNGSRCILAGAQALAMADIGMPEWVEKEFDYDNQPGISVGKISGFRKPVFESIYAGSEQDFSVLVMDVAQ